MTSSADYKAYIKTREYKSFPFKTKLKLAFAEEKRQWNERGWFYRIGVCCIFRPLIMAPITLAIVIVMYALAAILVIARVVFVALCHWQTYAIIGVIIAIIMLLHFGII